MSRNKIKINRLRIITIFLAILVGITSFAKFAIEGVVSFKLYSFTSEVYEAVSAYETSDGFNTKLPGYQETYDEAYKESLIKREKLKEELPYPINKFIDINTSYKFFIMIFDFLKFLICIFAIMCSNYMNIFYNKCNKRARRRNNKDSKCKLTDYDFLRKFDISM